MPITQVTRTKDKTCYKINISNNKFVANLIREAFKDNNKSRIRWNSGIYMYFSKYEIENKIKKLK